MTRLSVVEASTVVLLALVALTSLFMWPLINDVKTGATPQYPDIQPQRLSASPDEVFDAALDAAKAIGLEITSSERARGEIRGVARTRIMRFKDDVTINVTQENGTTVVNIRSTSRIGKGDFGANARRIREIQHLIVGKL